MDRAVQRLEPLDQAFDGDVMEIYVICLTFDGDDGDMLYVELVEPTISYGYF